MPLEHRTAPGTQIVDDQLAQAPLLDPKARIVITTDEGRDQTPKVGLMADQHHSLMLLAALDERVDDIGGGGARGQRSNTLDPVGNTQRRACDLRRFPGAHVGAGEDLIDDDAQGIPGPGHSGQPLAPIVGQWSLRVAGQLTGWDRDPVS